MSTHTYAHHSWIEKTAITLSVVVILFVAVYGLMIRSIMVNASAQSTTSRTLSDTSSRLADLEFEYIGLKQSVTLERAHELGFEEVLSPTFVKAEKQSNVSMIQ